MATVKKVITFDEDDAAQLRAALNGRAVSGLVDELRTAINSSVQPEGADDRRTRLVSGIKAGAQVDDEQLNALQKALAERKQLVQQIADLLGGDAERTRELLTAHENAESVVEQISRQLNN